MIYLIKLLQHTSIIFGLMFRYAFAVQPESTLDASWILMLQGDGNSTQLAGCKVYIPIKLAIVSHKLE